MVDIYVSAPSDALADLTPLTLMFGDVSPALTVPAGDYRMRITPSADPATVVFDSGTVPLAGGSDLVVAAITNGGTGAAPIELIATTGSASLRILDTNTPADQQVGNMSADAGVVDLAANVNFSSSGDELLAYIRRES